MTTPSTVEEKVSLRLLIHSGSNKVLYAEGDSDFVDVLFSFMTLPLGTIVRLVGKHLGPQDEAIGSLNNLYDSLKKLDNSCFFTEEAKIMLVNPRNSSETVCQKLKINIDDSGPTKYYLCQNFDCKSCSSPASVRTFNSTICSCGRLLNRETVLNSSSVQAGEGCFTLRNPSFIIRGDLYLKPYLVGSSIALLKRLGLKDTKGLEEKTIMLGSKEIISLLKLSMISNTPLSDMFVNSKPLKLEPLFTGISRNSTDSTANSKEMLLSVTVHKSTKKVIFAEADEDFIDFLFSMLAIPLGSVVSLLNGNTSLKSIDNLYESISSLETGKYLKSQDVSNMLLHPKLPPRYLSKNLIFNLFENSYNPGTANVQTSMGIYVTRQLHIEDPKFNGAFVRGPAVYIVTDDLHVTPYSSTSSFYFLNKSGISLCDVEQVTLKFGTEEALAILKASLTTASGVLTNVLKLVSSKPEKQPKQEK